MVSAPDIEASTPLHVAIDNGHYEVAKVLLEKRMFVIFILGCESFMHWTILLLSVFVNQFIRTSITPSCNSNRPLRDKSIQGIVSQDLIYFSENVRQVIIEYSHYLRKELNTIKLKIIAI